ncbi:hypothetical protein [Mucilaginibacter auburnensis]|uniref:Uncharacterized protein n=1 Tax=Mucilaginibacter auburnensis TaxID=1457233 RepID=A0A2H9VL75_9SPHI|nr:hypothetical protein [Mucilaginibacter auburnensis]PJJ79090.1 hypothetical protein CLV57_2214 [Mucilaginibacter auburnensis]
MDSLPFDDSGLTPATITNYQDIYIAVKGQFPLNATGHINFHLEDFESFKNCIEINVRASYVIKHERSDSYLLFTETRHKPVDDKEADSADYYLHHTWALAYLRKDFGHVVIRRETLRDKIIELIHPIELDFAEDKPFSNTFYTIVSDVQKAQSGIDRNFRNAVMDVRDDDFLIEIVNHTLIIGSHHPMLPEKAKHMAAFVHRLADLC